MIDLKVIPDDGDPYVLNVTSRDVMGWERVTKGASFQSLGETLNFTHLYALGHRAAKRTRVFDGTLAEFEESVDLELLEPEDGAPGVDPTKPGR